MGEHKPIGGKILTSTFLFFAAVVGIMGAVVLLRLIFGLDYVSDLNGGYPWGIWIAFDLLVGSGLACGGWAMAWTVYVANKGQYHPMVRVGMMTALFGYSMAGFSILIDMGRYWNSWQIAAPWAINTNSVLVETALCMTIYIGVLAVEFSPAILEKFNVRGLLKKLNKVMFLFIALGALLPTMHQSSMGSLMMIAGEKLHPLWRAWELLPLGALCTAFIMGFSIVIFEGSLSHVGLKQPSERELHARLSKVLRAFVAFFILIRWGEVIYSGKLDLVFTGDFHGNLFLLESALMLIPLLVLSSGMRHSARAQFLSALSLLLGSATWRMSIILFAYHPGDGFEYFPTAPEILFSLGLIAVEICGYLLLVKYFPVLGHHDGTLKKISEIQAEQAKA